MVFCLTLGFFACGRAGDPKETEKIAAESSDVEDTVKLPESDTAKAQPDTQTDTEKIPETEDDMSEAVRMNAVAEKVKDGRDAIVVIFHDDGNRETANYLAAEYERLDLRGSVAMIASKVYDPVTKTPKESEVDFWQGILDTGRFNLTAHTMTHQFWGVSDEAERDYYTDSSGNKVEYEVEAGTITNETKGARDVLRELFPSQRVLTFARAGFGTHSSGVSYSEKALELIAEYYVGARWTGGGLETVPAQNVHQFSRYMASAADDEEKWLGLVDKAIDEKSAIVFVFHNMVKGKASGITVDQEDTTELFEYVAEKVGEGKVWCAFFEDAVLYTEEARAARVESYLTGDKITVTLTDDLDDEIFNLPLTVKCQVPDDWSEIEAQLPDGTTVSLEAFPGAYTGTYVRFDAVPDSGKVVLKKAI